jgi:hypothetical protein
MHLYLEVSPTLFLLFQSSKVPSFAIGVYGAEQGTLTIMVGASSSDKFERAKPTLQMMSKRVIHCGDLGAGLAAKICNK